MPNMENPTPSKNEAEQSVDMDQLVKKIKFAENGEVDESNLSEEEKKALNWVVKGLLEKLDTEEE